MTNPFKAVGSTMAGLWRSCDHSDCSAPAMNKTGLILVSPLVIPAVFIGSLIGSAAEAQVKREQQKAAK